MMDAPYERKGLRLTRAEFEHMIENMEAAGKDVTELRKVLEEEYPPTPPPRKRLRLPEAPPTKFGIEPIMEKGIIVGFDIYDTTGTIIKDRKTIAGAIYSEYPGVRPEELDDASIGYGEYEAHVRLKR